MPSRSKPPKRVEKPFQEMTTAELREATKEFDEENVGDTFGVPDAGATGECQGLKTRSPRNGMGAKTISVTVKFKLLAKTDRLAREASCAPGRLLLPGGFRPWWAKKWQFGSPPPLESCQCL